MDPDSTTDAECKSLCCYLLDLDPDQYILEKYRKAVCDHRWQPVSKFDRFLFSAMRAGTWMIHLIDGYTWKCFRDSAVRKRLILVLAIVENSKSGARHLGKRKESIPANVIILLPYYVLTSTASLILGATIFSPVRLYYFIAKK